MYRSTDVHVDEEAPMTAASRVTVEKYIYISLMIHMYVKASPWPPIGRKKTTCRKNTMRPAEADRVIRILD